MSDKIPTTLIASDWNGLRESSEVDENGNVKFTKSLLVTCYFEKPYANKSGTIVNTGITKNVVVDSTIADKLFKEGAKLTKIQEQEKNGKFVTKYIKKMYEHQIIAQRATRIKIGFDGWSINTNGVTICLPKGRCEMVEKEIITKDENVNQTKKVTIERKQSDVLLDKIFTF